jgi:hypothetical protein
MYETFQFIQDISENEKITYHFICNQDLIVKLTEVVKSTRPSRRHRKWSEETWRSNGHKDFTPTHVPPDVLSEALEHFKKRIRLASPDF